MELIGGTPDYVLQIVLLSCEDEGSGALIIHYELWSEEFLPDIVGVGLGIVEDYGVSYGRFEAKKMYGGTEIYILETREACERFGI
jgi:hypothetical protein